MENTVNHKSDMILKAQSINAGISELIDIEKIINTNLSNAAKKMKYESNILAISLSILSAYLDLSSFVCFSQQRIVVHTERAVRIDIDDILDLSEYYSEIERTRSIYDKDDFSTWENNFFKNLSTELKKKCEPILKEIIEKLNSNTEYEFFVSSFEPYKAIHNFSGRIDAVYELIVDFR